MRAVALLRGVNDGGVRFRMVDIVQALETAGFTEVRTVLASGNVVLTSPDDDPRTIAAAVATVIQDRFGFDVAVIVVSLPVVREAVDEYPFPRTEDRHAYVVFADEVGAELRQRQRQQGDRDGDDRVREGDEPFGAAPPVLLHRISMAEIGLSRPRGSSRGSRCSWS